MSREILDCLKRERDICVKNVIHSQNTAFMFTPALRKKSDKLKEKETSALKLLLFARENKASTN